MNTERNTLFNNFGAQERETQFPLLAVYTMNTLNRFLSSKTLKAFG